MDSPKFLVSISNETAEDWMEYPCDFNTLEEAKQYAEQRREQFNEPVVIEYWSKIDD